jgi:vacuolar protein sorting-associated protein 13A/C
MLMNAIVLNYQKQGIRQWHKLLGSSDLIGNPYGLLDKVGTGFKEAATEPLIGLLQGPEQFAYGVRKGVGGLMSGVFGGGFESLGKISQSLISVTSDVRG